MTPVTAYIASAVAVCGPDFAFDCVEPKKKNKCITFPSAGGFRHSVLPWASTPCKDYER